MEEKSSSQTDGDEGNGEKVEVSRIRRLSSPAKFLASQVKHAVLANVARRGSKEVSPFLTLTFCASTLIGEKGRVRPPLLSKGLMTS